MTLQEVTAGVHAWVQPDGSWFINNAGAIHHGGEVVLVDTCATAARTRAFLAAVADVTGDAPIRLAVNTHWHGDHTFGNALLPPSTVLVGHADTRSEIVADTMLTMTLPPIWSPTPEWGISSSRVPTIALRDALTVFAGDRRVELHHPGHEAHTHGDVVAWVPEERVLFTGDLLFHRVTPLVLQGSFAGALRALEWLRLFPADHVVPGHGPLVERAQCDEVIDAQARYYRLVLQAASAGLAAGHSPLRAARECDLGDFAGWPDHQRIVLNLHRAYADATGTPMDLMAAFDDATTFNGGPLECAV